MDTLFKKIDTDGGGVIDVYELLDFLGNKVHVKGWCNANKNWGDASLTSVERTARPGVKHKWPEHLKDWAPTVQEVLAQLQAKLERKCVASNGKSAGNNEKWRIFDVERRGSINQRQFEEGCNKLNVSCRTGQLQQLWLQLEWDSADTYEAIERYI